MDALRAGQGKGAVGARLGFLYIYATEVVYEQNNHFAMIKGIQAGPRLFFISIICLGLLSPSKAIAQKYSKDIIKKLDFADYKNITILYYNDFNSIDFEPTQEYDLLLDTYIDKIQINDSATVNYFYNLYKSLAIDKKISVINLMSE